MTDACRKHIHCVCATRDYLLVCSVLCLFSYSYIKDHLKDIQSKVCWILVWDKDFADAGPCPDVGHVWCGGIKTSCGVEVCWSIFFRMHLLLSLQPLSSPTFCWPSFPPSSNQNRQFKKDSVYQNFHFFPQGIFIGQDWFSRRWMSFRQHTIVSATVGTMDQAKNFVSDRTHIWVWGRDFQQSIWTHNTRSHPTVRKSGGE